MFDNIRNKYKEFIYESFTVKEDDDQYIVEYHYKIEELEFHPKLVIDKKSITNKDIDSEFLNYLFFQYGLFDLMHYYKLTCSEKIVIKPMYIDDNQCMFFKKLLYNGLGEYFYINNIDLSFDQFTNFEVVGTKRYKLKDVVGTFEGNLIPIGGGKDSIVTMELLKDHHSQNKFFMLERNLYPKNKAGYDSIYMGGYNNDDISVIQNEFDMQLLELVKKGFLNGHIPISACISMSSFISAYLVNRKYIVLSNEGSANEGNIVGTSINHQYSKSYEYEKDFREYTENYLTKQISYFSLLRPWNEFQIMRKFLKHKQYLDIFRSCNRGTKKNIWCNHCSKCLYVYIMLYPYLTSSEIKKVFINDMLNDVSLEETFMSLVSDDYNKPFECVGEKKEINYVLQQAIKMKDRELPYLLKLYKDNMCTKFIPAEEVEGYFNDEHFVLEEYLELLR